MQIFRRAAILLLLAAGGAGAVRAAEEASEADRASVAGYLNADFQSVIRTAKDRVFPAVVYIRAVLGTMESGKDSANVISGSGVVISPDGELLTNYHVVDKVVEIRCLLEDGSAYPARVIGSDKDIDLALLKLELPEGMTLAHYAELDSGVQREGDFVMAMGAPWGLNRSVSIGIISCASRYLPDSGEYSLWYQTDASISPGNSGGPLVNTEGRVIGINTLGMTDGAIGFTIPAATIRDVLPRLRAYGKVNWAWLGMQFQVLHDFERNIYFRFDRGVIVAGTEPGSPARKAGILPGDRIIAVDGKPVTVMTREALPGFRRVLGLLPFDVPVEFTVVREDKELSIPITPTPKGEVEGGEISCPRWGLTAKAINRFDVPNLYFYCNDGVYIYGVSKFGNAGRAGLSAQDIILSVNDRPVQSLDELESAYREALDGIDRTAKVNLEIMRNGRTLRRIMDFSNDYDKE